MLKIQLHKHKTHIFRTFSCFGPHIWNSLPQDLSRCLTLSSFKEQAFSEDRKGTMVVLWWCTDGNNSNILYSSQRESKAVLRSYTLTYNEELNCTYLNMCNSVLH